VSGGQEFEAHRGYLFSIAYRLLGSAGDAEDIVQDTYLRYVQAQPAHVENLRGYLATITVRLCMDQLRSARARREVYAGPWLPEPIATADRPDLTETLILRESLSLAFLYMLEALAPLERVVFVLREVFDYDYADIAQVVEKSEANCRQVFHRARQRLAEHRARFEASSEQQRRVTEAFLHAACSGDMDQLLQLLNTNLSEDAVFVGDGGGKVRGAGLKPVQGAANVSRGLVGNLLKFPPDSVSLEEINGQPALVATKDGSLYAVLVLEVEDGRIRALLTVLNPDKLRPLGRQLGMG
jgi:RNA polymerase sigma-70 factor (ECF subfamily)